MTTGLAITDAASVARIALVGIGVGGTLTLSRPAEQADRSWRGTALDIVDCPENLGRGRAFGSDISAAAVNTSQHRLEALSPSLLSFRSWLDECASPVIGLTTAMTLPVVGHMVDVDLAAGYGTVVAVLVLGVIVNVGVASRETITAAA